MAKSIHYKRYFRNPSMGGENRNELMKGFGINSLPRKFLLDEESKFIKEYPKVNEDSFIQFIKKKKSDSY